MQQDDLLRVLGPRPKSSSSSSPSPSPSTSTLPLGSSTPKTAAPSSTSQWWHYSIVSWELVDVVRIALHRVDLRIPAVAWFDPCQWAEGLVLLLIGCQTDKHMPLVTFAFLFSNCSSHSKRWEQATESQRSCERQDQERSTQEAEHGESNRPEKKDNRKQQIKRSVTILSPDLLPDALIDWFLLPFVDDCLNCSTSSTSATFPVQHEPHLDTAHLRSLLWVPFSLHGPFVKTKLPKEEKNVSEIQRKTKNNKEQKQDATNIAASWAPSTLSPSTWKKIPKGRKERGRCPEKTTKYKTTHTSKQKRNGKKTFNPQWERDAVRQSSRAVRKRDDWLMLLWEVRKPITYHTYSATDAPPCAFRNFCCPIPVFNNCPTKRPFMKSSHPERLPSLSTFCL